MMAISENINKVLARELETSENGRKVIEFVNKRKINGYSTGREYTVLYTMKDFISKVSKPFDQVLESDIISYVAGLEGKEGTKAVKRIVIKTFFSSVGKEDIVAFISTKMPQTDIRASDLLTESEVSQMITLAQQVKYKAIISMLYESNCRIGELLNLRIKDVEFDTDCIRVTLKNEKNRGSRVIVLFDSMFYLMEYLKSEHSNSKDREAYLFHEKHPINLYQKLSQDSVNDTLQMLGRQANIDKKIHCHILRHSGSTRDCKLGYNESQLRFKNGWSSSSKMPSRYTHLVDSDLENKERTIRGMENKVELVIPRICPSCNFSNQFDSNFCKNCGMPVSDKGKISSSRIKNLEKLESLFEMLMKTGKAKSHPEFIEQVAEFNKHLSEKREVIRRE
jgi:site-specific recombinase XerD